MGRGRGRSGHGRVGAARFLQANGCDVVVFDKGRSPGGRVCSRQQDGCTFDHGAQNVKARGSALEMAAANFPRALLHPFSAPVAMHQAGKVRSGDAGSNTEPKWAATGGLAMLAHELARGLPLWTSTRVAHLQEIDEGFALYGEESVLLGRAKHVIMTAPGPQTAALLQSSDLREAVTERVAALSAAQYHRCLTIMFRYNALVDAEWYALLAEDRAQPLLWLARENAKGYVLPAAQTAFVAQLGPQISEELYAADDAEIAQRTDKWLRAAARELDGLPSPAWSSVKRWRYAQSHGTTNWDAVNPRGIKLLVAGDALCTKSRVELAYASGLRAAQQLLALEF